MPQRQVHGRNARNFVSEKPLPARASQGEADIRVRSEPHPPKMIAAWPCEGEAIAFSE